MNFEGETVRFVIGLCISAAAAIYTWIATRDKDNSQHIEAVEKTLGRRIAEHGNRLGVVEKDVEVMKTMLEHMPSKDEFAELQGDMKALKVAQESVADQVRTVRASLNRIEDFLLNGRGQ
ncbi:hypothetical protein AGMMS49545_02230 [Betaproteobacteria bacterium]|nr:hypothetical protein AGMMS49545_02230 [Betaproteobacteria bacterium]GHU43811.1 hypothetical protein AGMMS50289_10880 [Betaproteobacteria bacterium]